MCCRCFFYFTETIAKTVLQELLCRLFHLTKLNISSLANGLCITPVCKITPSKHFPIITTSPCGLSIFIINKYRSKLDYLTGTNRSQIRMQWQKNRLHGLNLHRWPTHCRSKRLKRKCH